MIVFFGIGFRGFSVIYFASLFPATDWYYLSQFQRYNTQYHQQYCYNPEPRNNFHFMVFLYLVVVM